MVPFDLGQKLFNETAATCDVTFQEYSADLGLGHTDIYLDDGLETTIRDFVRSSVEKSTSTM